MGENFHRKFKAIYKITYPNGKIYVGKEIIRDRPRLIPEFNRDLSPIILILRATKLINRGLTLILHVAMGSEW
jgi:hypothetical protein